MGPEGEEGALVYEATSEAERGMVREKQRQPNSEWGAARESATIAADRGTTAAEGRNNRKCPKHLPPTGSKRRTPCRRAAGFCRRTGTDGATDRLGERRISWCCAALPGIVHSLNQAPIRTNPTRIAVGKVPDRRVAKGWLESQKEKKKF